MQSLGLCSLRGGDEAPELFRVASHLSLVGDPRSSAHVTKLVNIATILRERGKKVGPLALTNFPNVAIIFRTRGDIFAQKKESV